MTSHDEEQDSRPATALRRVLGPISVGCVGVGAAIGSGIFATPGEAARYLASPVWILLVWIAAGGITLLQSLVTAELATRFPRAGGEYQYLKAAYGEFAAFFFGWSFTIFIIGAGSATIAALLGDFLAQLFRLDAPWVSSTLGCAAIGIVVLINAVGLRTGAYTQTVLTVLKIAALLVIAAGAMIVSNRYTPVMSSPPAEVVIAGKGPLEAFFLALLPVFWSYTGATDSAKLAEETRDARRALPRAICGAAVTLTAVYVAYNYALLCAAGPAEIAGRRSVPSYLFERHGAPHLGDALLAVSALVCFGSISSTMLANVRVTFALARDGLTFPVFARMSAQQSPVASFVLCGLLACFFVVNRSFSGILRIYFLASALIFGLTYLSLIVFRLRDRRGGFGFPDGAFRAPAGPALAIALVALELAIALTIVQDDLDSGGRDSLWTLAFLAAMAVGFRIWKKMFARGASRSGQ